MFRRKIYTKNESLGNIWFLIVFVILWYASLLGNMAKNNFSSIGTTSIFLVAGILPLGMLIQSTRKALYYRRLHRQCMNRSPRKGKIISCVRGSYRETTSKGGSRRVYEYYLKIEVYDAETMIPTTIQSEAYSWPVYRVLSSPDVDVYTDETGWNYVIDGFHYKTSRKEPDIFVESAFDKAPGQNSQRLFSVVFLVIVILMVLRTLNIIS